MDKYCGGEKDGMVTAVEPMVGKTGEGEVKMLMDNMGLVYREAWKFAPRGAKAPDEDLVQIGRIALWEAVKRFDAARGAKFSTYAVPCIRNRMLNELEKQNRRRALIGASLQDPAGEDGSATLADLYADEAAETPFEAAEWEETAARVRQEVEKLPESDREVVEARFGLRGGEPRSLAEIAQDRGVSPQRVHKVCHRGLDRLGRNLKVA